MWRDGWVVEGNGLENRRSIRVTQGSNPCLSAIFISEISDILSLNPKNGKVAEWLNAHPC